MYSPIGPAEKPDAINPTLTTKNRSQDFEWKKKQKESERLIKLKDNQLHMAEQQEEENEKTQKN